jgi:hypothetical protein
METNHLWVENNTGEVHACWPVMGGLALLALFALPVVRLLKGAHWLLSHVNHLVTKHLVFCSCSCDRSAVRFIPWRCLNLGNACPLLKRCVHCARTVHRRYFAKYHIKVNQSTLHTLEWNLPHTLLSSICHGYFSWVFPRRTILGAQSLGSKAIPNDITGTCLCILLFYCTGCDIQSSKTVIGLLEHRASSFLRRLEN